MEPDGGLARPIGMKALLATLTALCILGVAACARSSQAPGGGGSGVRGTILAGPACGGPIIMGSPCPDKPVAADISVSAAGSADVVATARSGSDGRFSIDLAPGDYTLTTSATGGAPFPAGRPTEVTVRAGAFTEVTLHMDTGLR